MTSPPGYEAKQGKVTLVSVIVLQCHMMCMMCMHDDMQNPLHIGRKGRTPQDLHNWGSGVGLQNRRIRGGSGTATKTGTWIRTGTGVRQGKEQGQRHETDLDTDRE